MHTLDTVSTGYASVTTSWDLAASVTWTKLRLVRSSDGRPRDERDGTVLFEDDLATARTSYTDTGLTTGRYYYYGLFVLTSSGWLSMTAATFLVTKDWGYTAKLYSSLPEVFKSDDYATVTDPVVVPEDSFLYRFLSVFGFQLDALRSEAESVRHLLDAKLTNQVLLPALAAQVGVPYEPEIGTRSLRQFIANAIHLWSIKGTVPGVRELASVLTGYVTHVRIGKNLVLDGLDAGPTTDVGRWRGRTNAAVTYRANAATDVNPAGDGVRIITATGAGTTLIDTNRGGTDTVLRRLYAVPVLPGQSYTNSQYARTPGAASTFAARTTWLDANGVVIGADDVGANATLNGGWTRASVTSTSPAGARYAILGMSTAALTAGQTVEHCGVQFEEGALTAWQCARQIRIYFDPEIINYVGNTSGAAPSNYGWSTGVEAAVDATLGPFLTKYTPDPEDPNAIAPSNAYFVDYPGDTAPVPPTPEDSLAATEVYYTGAHVAVAAGQVWTALAQAKPPPGDTAGDPTRFGKVGIRLYSGATFVRHVLGNEVALVRDAWTDLPACELTIPADADFDHIEVCIVTEGPCGFRHVALEPVNQHAAFFFDGSSASATGDYLWDGTPFQSSTFFYDRRSFRTVRLKSLLIDFLPHGSCYDIIFGVAAPASSPASISGVTPDPATSLPL